MEQELVCIVCPNGCRLHLQWQEEGGPLTVTGNACPRGEAFARAELAHPMRSLTTTVRAVGGDLPVLPVRTDGEIPKEQIFAAIAALARVTASPPLRCGDIVCENLLGLGVNVVATCPLASREEEVPPWKGR